MAVQISPSILSADFARLAEEAKAVEDAADWLHVDVMDNHFVPNLTFGQGMVEALLKHTSLPIDCHLMFEEPDRHAPGFAEVGAQSVTFHAEAAQAPVRLARMIRSAGARAGIGIKPATSIEPYADLLPEVDMVLIMTVEPGFGGQSFMADQVTKMDELVRLRRSLGLSFLIEVDGGVSDQTVGQCQSADVLVAGSYVFKNDYKTAIDRLKGPA